MPFSSSHCGHLRVQDCHEGVGAGGSSVNGIVQSKPAGVSPFKVASSASADLARSS